MAKTKTLTAPPSNPILTANAASDMLDQAGAHTIAGIEAFARRLVKLTPEQAVSQTMLASYAQLHAIASASEKALKNAKEALLAHIDAKGEIEKGAFAAITKETSVRRPKYEEIATGLAAEIATTKALPFDAEKWREGILESTKPSKSISLTIVRAAG